MGSDLVLALGLEVEVLSRPALYLKQILVPQGTVMTIVPLDGLLRTGSYKDWVMLEMPKCGCVNIHLSRTMPIKEKPLNTVAHMPLFPSIPMFDQQIPPMPDDSILTKTPEITLVATVTGLMPADFLPFCRYAFVMGLQIEENGRLELEDMCYSSFCMHSCCIDINRNAGSELARLRGNIKPNLIYSTPCPPPYPSLHRLCFPTGLQLCFHTTPPKSHTFTQLLPDGLRCYGCLFYAAVNCVEFGLKQTKTVFVPTVLGVISQVTDSLLMMRIVETIVQTELLNADLLTLRPLPLHQDTLLHLTLEVPLPQASSQAVHFTIQGLGFDYRPQDCFSCLSGHGTTLDIKPEVVISALNSLLLERKVLVVSASEAKLSQIITLFLELLYPLDWPHLVIPILPLSLLEVLSAPRPMLIGIKEHHMPTIAAYYPELGKDAVLIRLDSTHILDLSIDLPKPILASLHSDLKAAEGEEGRVREAAAKALGKVLEGYKDYITSSNGVNYLHQQGYLQTISSVNRPFVEKFIGTSLFLLFLQRHANRDKYAFHKILAHESLPSQAADYITYVVPALCDTLPTTSSSGSYYRDILPSPRRPPNFNTSLDFSYSSSEDEEEAREVSFRPIGLPSCANSPTHCYFLPDNPAEPIPPDLETTLPQRISGFSVASTPAVVRVVSSAQSLIARLIIADPPRSVCGQLLRLMLTSNLEPSEIHHLCTVLRALSVRTLFLSALRELTQGRVYELRYRAYMYFSQILESITIDCMVSGDFGSAAQIVHLSDRIYYLTPSESREYLIEELAGYGLWSWLEFWRPEIQLEAAFEDMLKAAGLMMKLDIELEVAKKLLVRLSALYSLDLEQAGTLSVLAEKMYKARMLELEEELG